jgi:hypothetical protein
VHGPRFPLKRGRHLIHREQSVFLLDTPNGVKGYRLIDLSSDILIIEHSVQFEESVSHVPQQPHADTFVLPPVRDDEHAHADSSLDESFDSQDLDDPIYRFRYSQYMYRVSACRCRCRARVEAQVGSNYSSGCRGSCWGSY